jgi:tetratricopeptide (TPR) repeat protein
MVCRLLKGLEAGRIPDAEGDLAALKVGGIVYLSRNGAHQVDYPTLVADLLRLLPEQEARRLERLYQDPHQSPAQVMLAVLEAFPAGEPVVVLASGNPRQAVALLGEAVSIADTIGDVEPAVEARSWLARAYLQLGDPAAALAATTARRDLSYPAEEPAMRLLEGLALLELGRREESVRAFNEAVTAAGTLLALADRNVAALQARALALSGLAAAVGDLALGEEAGEAFEAADAVTGAAGVAADTRRILDQIARHDRSGVLARARAAKGQGSA